MNPITIPAGVTDAVEATMADTCIITRPGTGDDASTFDESTGLIDPGTPTTVYAGPCSLIAPKQATRSNSGGDQRTVDRRTIRLPLDAPPILAGDTVTVAGVEPMVVDEPIVASIRSQRRIRCVASTDAPGVPT